MILRDYQQAAVDNVFECYGRNVPTCLVVHPTGTGKTAVFSAVAERMKPRRTLILAHRGELLTQASDTLGRFDLSCAIEKADEYANPNDLFGHAVLASVQTMKGARLARWPQDAFGLVVVDEAHHAPAPSYKAILNHFSSARRLFVTATPERGDGNKLGNAFPGLELAHEYKMRQAIQDEHLCRLLIERPTTTVDLSKIRTTAGDLNQGDLEDEIGKHIEELVNATKERIGDRPFIVFTPDVGSGEAFADGLRQVGIDARSVNGKSDDRVLTIKQFRDGDFQGLSNCMLATEGFDAPRVSAIVLARPTMSGVLYRQMVGRGTRPFPGKENCLVLDFAWNSGRHDLVSPIELFDTKDFDSEVMEIADKLVKSGKQKDPLKAVEEAEQIHRKNLAMRMTVKARATRYKFMAFDPFEVGSLLGVTRRKPAANALPATTKQQCRLDQVFKTYEIDYNGVTKAYADRLLGEIEDRKKQGLATHRQVACLIANGIDQDVARSMPFKEASAQLDTLIGGRR